MARKQKMKVYHGIPKSITDEHTLFYDSFDGTNISLKDNSFSFVDSPTGYGIKILNTQHMKKGIPLVNTGVEAHTLDCWFYSGTTSFDVFNFEDKSTPDQMKNRSITLYYVKNKGMQLTYFAKNSEHQPKTIVVPNTINTGWTHLRLTIEGNLVSLYVNGKLHPETITKVRPFNSVWLGAYPGFGGSEYKIPLMSDLHISKINRGAYFPNLPQDFIAGKATIKPRMNQQQIKGDPMHSQVTKLKVHAHTAGDWSLYNPVPVNGAHSSYNNPELSIAGGTNWAQGSFVRITGLNGEVISGVVDTDTALCKVLKAIETNHLVVDSIDKLQVDDVIVGYNTTTNQPDIIESQYTITEILPETSSIKVTNSYGNYWSQSAIDSGWTVAVEVTASSSCPTVKTENGTNVVGTWSGLGTNTATFTLGDNPAGLQGKDLYVEYSLTIPHGNSDFPELPYIIERALGDNGIEMKPVDQIVIVDDFKYKKHHSIKACPHIGRWRYMDNINAVPTVGEEFSSNGEYKQMSTLNGECLNVSTGANIYIPQIVLSFNLIDIIERKLGCVIPGPNKIEWIYTNVAWVTFNAYAKGECPTGAYVQLNVYKDGVGWVDSIHNSANSIQKMSWSNIIHDGRVSSDGFINFLLSTKISDGVHNSGVLVDYAEITIALKTNSEFTTLYCGNKRAREDRCNPVLIQRETKTIKRYLPSRECFTTECKMSEFKGAVSPATLYDNSNKALAIRDYQLNSMGTGKFLTYFNYFDYIASLCNVTKEAAYQFDSSSIGQNVGLHYGSHSSDPKFGGGIMYTPREKTFANRAWGNMVDTSKVKCPHFVQIIPYLMYHNGEVVLCLINSIFKNSKYTKEEVYYFHINNRPLIKNN